MTTYTSIYKKGIRKIWVITLQESFWDTDSSPKFKIFFCVGKNLIYAAASSSLKIVSISLHFDSVGITGT